MMLKKSINLLKNKRSCYYRASAFHSNLLTHYLKHVKIKIQRGAIVVDGLPLKIFSYKKATVVSQAGGCFFALSEPIIYPSVKKKAKKFLLQRASFYFYKSVV